MQHSPSISQRNTAPFIILGTIGAAFLALTLIIAIPQAAFVLRAKHATATFQGAVAHSGGNHGGTFLYPQFRFAASNGQTITFTTKNGSTAQPYNDGQTVPVLYDPTAPNHAILDSFWSLWTATLVPALFALGFLGLPFLIWRSSQRQQFED